MNNMNVIALPATTNLKPEQALNSVLQLELSDVPVIGYKDGHLVVRSSKMTCAEALFLLERGKSWALSGGQE
jgi:hypothetical protein